MAGTGKTRQKKPEQWDLFGERGHDVADASSPREDIDPTELDDHELIEQLPKATLSNVHALCEQVTQRGLGDAAVPALEALWLRFRGFGITSPLIEQLLALNTLGSIGGGPARDVIQRVIDAKDLPACLFPHALQAAVTSRLHVPLRLVLPWLEHEDPMVRAPAFTLAQRTQPPAHVMEAGLTDPYALVRRSALVAMGNLGHKGARPGLLAELNRNPTSEIVFALVAIADEDVIRHLGRCAMQNEALHPIIVEELEMLDTPIARVIVQRLTDQT